MSIEGRRIEPGFCPQCHHIQSSDSPQLPQRCAHCHLPLRLVAGRYRLLEQLSEGSHAWIFRAHDIATTPLEERAVKVFKPGMLDEITEKLRFQREVKVTTDLSRQSPHIVQMYDDAGFESEIGHFYVMEMLRGVSLDELMMEGVPLGNALTFHIVEQICQALSVVHSHGVIHRDLKPPNIFLAEIGDEPHFVKLIDFGIAKRSNTHHHYLTQEIIGTPLYMSPEQCMSQPLDGRADIYAIGVLVYTCLTGTIPFALKHDETISYRKRMLLLMQAHVSAPARPLSEARPDLGLPEALDGVVLKALAKEASDRYPTIGQFWDALQPFARQL